MVKIEETKFEDSWYKDGEKWWRAKTLYDWAKQNKYPVFDLPLSACSLSTNPYEINNLSDFLDHCNRVKNADEKIPIILDDYGDVADGNHRIIKAILKGKDTIKAIRLEEMPEPDRIEKEKVDN